MSVTGSAQTTSATIASAMCRILAIPLVMLPVASRWLGLLAGMLAKVVLAFTMVGVFGELGFTFSQATSFNPDTMAKLASASTYMVAFSWALLSLQD